ncbi:MAG: maltotransferase domain-containing protein, partial [Acidimicrobiales bacterium]
MKEKDVLTARRQIPPPTTEVVIESPHPIVDGGRFAVKGIVGDPIEVSADVFSHGHGLVRALARIRRVGARRWDESPMAPLGNDRFAGLAVPRAEGPFEIEIAASPDELATWANDARRRLEAARMDAFDPEIGGDLLEEAASCLLEAGLHAGSRTIMDLASAVRTGLRLEVLDAIGANAQLLSQRAIAGEGAATVRLKGFASRERAAFSSWYE